MLEKRTVLAQGTCEICGKYMVDYFYVMDLSKYTVCSTCVESIVWEKVVATISRKKKGASSTYTLP